MNKRYTLEEAKEFLKNRNVVGIIDSEYDSCGNYWCTEVIEKDGKNYAVDFLDGTLCPVRPKKKDEDNWYEFPEVKPVKVEITEWKYL